MTNYSISQEKSVSANTWIDVAIEGSFKVRKYLDCESIAVLDGTILVMDYNGSRMQVRTAAGNYPIPISILKSFADEFLKVKL
jgi:hypothetical protein